MRREALIDLFEAARKIGAAAVPDEIVRELRYAIRSYGFSACLITKLPGPNICRWHDYILVNSWPQEWYARYNQSGHFRHDPCAERSRNTGSSFFWSDLDRQSMAPASKIVMDEAAEFGLSEGICVPVHSPFAPPSVITISGESTDVPQSAILAIDALARHGFQALLRLRNRRDNLDAPLLSEREREILQWAGAGKTAWEISCILGISFHTVNTHLRNAREKFGVATTTHCVVEALRRQEIQL
jgi:LuxR family quorum sensing-dependent transcriptional regulator